MESTLKGDSFGQYNERVIKSWKESVPEDKKYLIDLKSKQYIR